MNELYHALLELQALDREIAEREADMGRFDPELREIDAPVTTLEQEIENARTRVTELRQQSSKLEQAANSKRERLKAYEARIERIRSVREEAASRTEIDLVRRAIEADENEALDLMEQSTRTDLKLDDQQKQLDKLRSEAEPKKQDLLASRQQAEQDLAVLRDQRNNQASRVDKNALRLYERVRTGKSLNALAPLKAGACGNCFNMIPLQEQADIKRADSLKRCEACGVILYPED